MNTITEVTTRPVYSGKQIRKMHHLRQEKERTNIINRKSLVFKRSKSNTTRITWSD